MKRNKILVIIVAYNSKVWIDRCYNSLRASSVPCDIFVIDNGSSDGTPDYIKEYFPEVELIESKLNLGFGKANNIGLQKALDEKYEYVYLLNQDAWILPDTFAQLIKTSQKNPEYGILSPMQLEADGNHFDYKFATHVIGNNQKTRPLLSEDIFFNRKENIYQVSFVMAAHWFITHSCLEKVGGFSPTFFHYGEDDNYLNRVQYWNYKIGIVPNAFAVHDRKDSSWNEKKLLYINHYTIPLNKVSNPLSKQKIWTYVRENLIGAIVGRNMQLWKYGIKLIREHKKIEINYKRSLHPTAFLEFNK